MKSTSRKRASRRIAESGQATPKAAVGTLDSAISANLASIPETSYTVQDEPGHVYEALLGAAGTTLRRTTLANLRLACEAERNAQRPDFSYAGIARRVKELSLGRPSQQTIYNDQGIRSLIEAYKARHQPAESTTDEHVLRGITDQQTRNEVRLLLAERQQLQTRVNILHAQFQRLELAAIPGSSAPAIAAASRPNPEEQAQARSVASFIRHVEQHGLYWDEATGALLQNRDGRAPREVGGPGFKQALEHLLGGT